MSVWWANRFWSVSLELTLFLDFLKLFVKMHLVVSFTGKKNHIFWTYWSKVMGVWSFKEKFGQGGHVLQPTNKSWPFAQKVEGRKKKKFKKNGNSPNRAGRRPAGQRLALLDCPHFFEIFLFKKNKYLEVWEMDQGFWENGCTTPPFFEACPYTWKC
jgi:hypothetical protein